MICCSYTCLIYGFKMKKLSQKIVNLLSKQKLKISFVESCTGGLLSSSITSISGLLKFLL